MDRNKLGMILGLLSLLLIGHYTRTWGSNGWIGGAIAVVVAITIVEVSRGKRFTWWDAWYVITGFALVGVMEYYVARHELANDLSILLMAMVFAAFQTYLIARWWSRRHARPLP